MPKEIHEDDEDGALKIYDAGAIEPFSNTRYSKLAAQKGTIIVKR